MSIEIHSSVEIAKPVEEVFPFFLDVEKAVPLMDPDVQSVTKTPDGPIGVGTTYRLQQHVAGKLRETDFTYTRIDPDQRIDFDAHLGVAAMRMAARFDENQQGTRVRVDGQGAAKGLFRLMPRRVQKMGQQAWDNRLERLKASLEAM
jgi:carbon monoxide dehydrogenase subunit G